MKSKYVLIGNDPSIAETQYCSHLIVTAIFVGDEPFQDIFLICEIAYRSSI